MCIVCLVCLLSLPFHSCQKFDDDFYGRDNHALKDLKIIPKVQDNLADLYFGPKKFIRFYRAPRTETVEIINPDFGKYDGNFVLKIKNGNGKRNRVSSAEIRIDGKLVVSRYDFCKNVTSICRKISGLTAESVLSVKLNGSPGSFIVLWIEGTRITGEVTDIDGNSYRTLKIGGQWWMTDNLKVTRFQNGDLIGTTTPANMDISGESTPKYQWAFKGNESYVAAYGRLYTWYAVTDSRGVCPAGWHVPSDEEWTILTDHLINNGYGYEGSGTDIGKSIAAVSGWRADATPGHIGNDQASNNSSGFNGIPAGDRLTNGIFINLGAFAGWWSTTENNAATAWYRGIFYNISVVNRSADSKKFGGAVRCVRD
jgi:uncharacterized protein (TIGR02145 family)